MYVSRMQENCLDQILAKKSCMRLVNLFTAGTYNFTV